MVIAITFRLETNKFFFFAEKVYIKRVSLATPLKFLKIVK